MRTESNQANPNIVFWILWASILGGICFFQFNLGGGIPKGTNEGPPPTAIYTTCIVFVAASAIIRWIFVPRTKERGKLLVLTIAGLALSEGAQIFQIFLIGSNYPETQFSIFILSLLGTIQFIPIFLKKEL